MDRHWTLDVVALAGVVAGFALFVSGQSTPLVGVLAAGSAYAFLLPELVESSVFADPAAR